MQSLDRTSQDVRPTAFAILSGVFLLVFRENTWKVIGRALAGEAGERMRCQGPPGPRPSPALAPTPCSLRSVGYLGPASTPVLGWDVA